MGGDALVRVLATAALLSACCPSAATASMQSLAPVADTFVSPGRQASRDHGGSSQLRVQGARRIAYLKFDLSALPAPVSQATLVLSVTRGGPDGGMVSRVADTAWVEGHGPGAPANTGLRFVDLDANGDGRLDAGDASPLVPTPGDVIGVVGSARPRKAIRIDVTPAFAGGPGVYTLAIWGASAGGTAYASREHPVAAWRPRLEIVLGDGGAPSGLPAAGRPAVFRFAKSDFTPFTDRPTPQAEAWMRDHYWRMVAYAPYFDTRLAWYPDAWVYKDLYAIYAGTPTATVHPEWILRDAGGQKLFIPYACGGGTCPQYAADPGSAAFRAHWIAEARDTLAQGYEGLYVDDVNLFLSRVGDGAGHPVVPVDPRTGRAMTEPAWRRYVAEFVEAVRTAFPGVEIVHNAIWYVGDDDPFVARQIAAADYQNLERGVNDAGIVGGGGPYGFDTFLDHIDRVHAAGRGFLFDGEGADLAGREYSLAAYFLVKGERDGITHDHGTTPDDWWAAGWEVDLGNPLGGRYAWNGLWRRDFTDGLALVNPPGASTQHVPLGGSFRDLAGRIRTSVVLGPAEGVVLRGG